MLWMNVASALAFALAALASPILPRAEPGFPDPHIDPFYKAPHNISRYHPGQVIRSRTVPTTIVGLYSSSHQVLFRTNNHFNQAVGTVVTIWIPDTPSSPPKIFAYNYAEDGDNRDCAPSWAWVQNSGSDSQESERLVQGPFLIPWGVQNGYYVISTDAEGPDSTWLVGLMEGRAVLDAIRATTSFLSLKKPSTALYGYSGGSHTTVWASSLAKAYAPELDIVGAAYGGTPVDLRSAFNLDDGTASSLVVGAALFGLANGYPKLNKLFKHHLTPNGVQIAKDFRAEKNCTSFADAAYMGSFNYTSIFRGNIINAPVLNNVLAQESLLSNVSSLRVPVPLFPRYEYHGSADTTVPYQPEVIYVQQQCAKGANIQFTTYQGLDHAPTAVAGLSGALQFIQQAFAGNTPSVACGSSATSTSKSNIAEMAKKVFGPALLPVYEQMVQKLG